MNMDKGDGILYISDMDNHDYNFRINNVVYTVCAPDWSWTVGHGGMADFDLWNVEKGTGRIEGTGFSFPVRQGSAVLLRPGDTFTATHEPDDPLTVTSVHFDFVSPRNRKRVPHISWLGLRHRLIEEQGFYGELLERLRRSWFDERDKQAVERWFAAIWQEVRNQDNRPEVEMGLHFDQIHRIEELCRDIYENPGRRWRVDDMAAYMHCSPDYFTRIFKRLKGYTPKYFLVQARMDMARSLLRGSSHAVGRIAELLGYNDVYHFSRQFKECNGISPTDFRRV